jgi:hypothetical protein
LLGTISTQWWRCGSINKTQSPIVTDSWNYVNDGGSMWTTWVFMLKSNCIKLQNEIQEMYLSLFQWSICSHYVKKIGRHYFSTCPHKCMLEAFNNLSEGSKRGQERQMLELLLLSVFPTSSCKYWCIFLSYCGPGLWHHVRVYW